MPSLHLRKIAPSPAVRRAVRPMNQQHMLRGFIRHTSQESSDAIKRPMQKLQLPDPIDPRPRWAFTMQKISTFLVIPTVFLYAIFLYDFGEHEHIFSAPRRWLKRQQEAFFSLSPAEQELVQQATKSEEAAVSDK